MYRSAPILICTILIGCASPDPRLYTLVPTGPEPIAAGAPALIQAGPQAGPQAVIELRRVAIPGYLDRPEIVRSEAEYRVHLAGNERWSEPFGDLVVRVLAADLARAMPDAVVTTDADAIAPSPTRTVSVSIARLDSDGAGTVILDARIDARAPDQATPATTSSRVVLHAAIAGPTTADYAGALSNAVASLAQSIAALLARPAPST